MFSAWGKGETLAEVLEEKPPKELYLKAIYHPKVWNRLASMPFLFLRFLGYGNMDSGYFETSPHRIGMDELV